MVKTIPIKWKLTIAFVAMSLIFVLIYLFLAQKTFKNDKIAYVYETQQNQAQVTGREFTAQFEKLYFVGKSILLTYNPTTKKISPQGELVFQDNTNILGLEMIEETTKQSLIHLQRADFPPDQPGEITSEMNQIRLFHIQQNVYLISTRETNSFGNIFRTRMLVQKTYEFPASSFQSILLSQESSIIEKNGESIKNLQTLPQAFVDASNTATFAYSLGTENFLISKAKVGFGNFYLYVVTPESIVFSGINDLYRKSIVFLFFTVAIALLLSFLLAHALTSGLIQLTEAANEIGKNNFEVKVNYSGKDEIGILATAFRNMTLKIKNLLKETAATARMQLELETAKIVQDTLFPKQSRFENQFLKLVGKFMTASECGGDWWWHWQVDDKLFLMIADATGHGAPAALITSAARSCMATIEKSKITNIQSVAEIMNDSIFHTSQGFITMSAFIFEFDSKIMNLRYINCSHVGSAIFRPLDPKGKSQTWRDVSFLDNPRSAPLGRFIDSRFEVGTYTFKSGERLVLFTDGITEAISRDGKAITDRSLYSQLVNLHQKTAGQPGVFIEGVFEVALAHYNGQDLPDDLTSVVVDFL